MRSSRQVVVLLFVLAAAHGARAEGSFDGLYVGKYEGSVTRCPRIGQDIKLRVTDNHVELVGADKIPVDVDGAFYGQFLGPHQGPPTNPRNTEILSGKIADGVMKGRQTIIPAGSDVVCSYTFSAKRLAVTPPRPAALYKD